MKSIADHVVFVNQELLQRMQTAIWHRRRLRDTMASDLLQRNPPCAGPWPRSVSALRGFFMATAKG